MALQNYTLASYAIAGIFQMPIYPAVTLRSLDGRFTSDTFSTPLYDEMLAGIGGDLIGEPAIYADTYSFNSFAHYVLLLLTFSTLANQTGQTLANFRAAMGLPAGSYVSAHQYVALSGAVDPDDPDSILPNAVLATGLPPYSYSVEGEQITALVVEAPRLSIVLQNTDAAFAYLVGGAPLTLAREVYVPVADYGFALDALASSGVTTNRRCIVVSDDNWSSAWGPLVDYTATILSSPISSATLDSIVTASGAFPFGSGGILPSAIRATGLSPYLLSLGGSTVPKLHVHGAHPGREIVLENTTGAFEALASLTLRKRRYRYGYKHPAVPEQFDRAGVAS